MKDNLLRIHIDDIPPEGRNVEFSLSVERLNERVALGKEMDSQAKQRTPDYLFSAAPEAKVRLSLEGSTVLVDGTIKGTYRTVCARCAEDTETDLETKLHLVLKPHSERSVVGAEEEDLNFGIYEEETIDCSSIAEEFLVLALPFTVLCGEKCKGLCPHCGKNLNAGPCSCREEKEGDPRLKALRDLKLLQ